MSDALVQKFAARGAIICTGYGMTETGPTAFLTAPSTALSHLGSAGQLQLFSQARIVDRNDQPVAPGEAGEVQFFGPSITPGYWSPSGIDRSSFTSDGWLRSGDIAKFDEDGFIYIVGRLKDMFISGGENVFPAEIEQILHAHPQILEAAVIGVQDAKWGEVGCAFVCLAPDAMLSSNDVQAFVREQLAAYKVPKLVHFVDQFPRTPSGKIQKYRLMPQAVAV